MASARCIGRRRVAGGLAALIVAATAASASASAATLDCPMRDRRFSLDTPLLDILLSPVARAAVERSAPTLPAGLPPRILSTATPTQANVLTPRSLAALKHMDPASLAPLAVVLRGLPVSAADKAARCARYDDDPLVVPPPSGRPRLLLFEKITGFRDGPSVDAAAAAVRAIAARRGWDVIATDRGGAMTAPTLAAFDAVVWNNVSGDALTRRQRAAFRRYVARGGGFVGIHGSGGDPFYDWRWYRDALVGARFVGHTMAPQFQDARVVVDDPGSAIVQGLGGG